MTRFFPCHRRARLLRQALAAAASALLFIAPAQAYESDVHYGLTQWLARQAGFEPSQAEAVATGNQRVDSGLIDTLELNLEYACSGRWPDAAVDVQRRHFPAAGLVPAPADQRAVVPGSAAARKPVADLLSAAVGKEGVLLGLLGATLHTLQDSWSHAGIPGLPQPGGGLTCDPALASGHPAGRGGPDGHDADLTHRWPADTVAMAKATYDVLSAYPRVQGRVRSAMPWSALTPAVERFARARSKTEKRDWFVAQGIESTAFLEGISLPNGPRPGPLAFGGRKLPPLKNATSSQHDVPVDARAFFDRLMARWLGSESVESVVADMAGGNALPAKGATLAKADPSVRDLAARMKAWKLNDHGAVAELLHTRAALKPAQLQAIDRLARAPGALVRPAAVADAFFPLLAKGKYASPLLPYIVRELPAAAGAKPRVVAIARLRHAPYDTLAWIAERGNSGWRLVAMVSAVDQ